MFSLATAYVFTGVEWEPLTGGGSGTFVDLISDKNVTIGAANPVIDSVPLLTGMAVLLARQIDYVQNGVYVYNGTTLVRDESADIGVGTIVSAERGTVYEGSSFVCTYSSSKPWVAEITETSWHDMIQLANVPAMFKMPVDAISTIHVVEGAGGAPNGTGHTINGVAVAVDDRVLLIGQNDPKHNGIWVVRQGPWERADDMSAIGDLVLGTSVTVDGGFFKKTVWTCGWLETEPWRPDVGNRWYSDSSLTYAQDITFTQAMHTVKVTHNLGTPYVTVTVFDRTVGDTIFTLVKRDLTSSNPYNSVDIGILPETLAPGEKLEASVIIGGTYERVQAPGAPLPPGVSLVAIPLSATSIRLVWGMQSTEPDHYVLYRDGTEIFRTADNATITYTDTGLTASTQYTYKVEAYTSDDTLLGDDIATTTTPA